MTPTPPTQPVVSEPIVQAIIEDLEAEPTVGLAETAYKILSLVLSVIVIALCSVLLNAM